MGNDSANWRSCNPHPDLCEVCGEWEFIGPGLPVDRDGVSPDEADRLCATHRARMTEGLCVLCSRRLVWMPIRKGSDTGMCRVCYVKRHGEEKARSFEGIWRDVLEEE